MAIDDESRTHHGSIGSILGLPGLMAEHGRRWSGRLIVLRREQTAAERHYAERRKVATGDILGAQ